MKGINEWAKDLKHNEKVAEQFEGVKSVSDIISVAKKNGYNFTEQELMDLDLDAVAGGNIVGWGGKGPKLEIEVKTDIKSGTATATAVGTGSTAQCNPEMNFKS